MATNTKRHCVYCDREVKPPTEALRTIGKDEGEGQNVFVHVSGTCGHDRLTESQTYTMGDAEPES